MKKTKALFLVILSSLVVLIILVAILNSQSRPSPREFGAMDARADSKATSTDDLIHINSLKPGDQVSSPFDIIGEARGYWYYDGEFPVVLTDATGKTIAETEAKSTRGWMSTGFVPFELAMTFPDQAVESKGYLILKRENPSGMPQNEMSLKIPVTFGESSNHKNFDMK